MRKRNESQTNLCGFSEWSRSAIFSAIRGALPPARLLMIRFTLSLSFRAAFTILAVSSIISGSSMPGSILLNGKALTLYSSQLSVFLLKLVTGFRHCQSGS